MYDKDVYVISVKNEDLTKSEFYLYQISAGEVVAGSIVYCYKELRSDYVDSYRPENSPTVHAYITTYMKIVGVVEIEKFFVSPELGLKIKAWYYSLDCIV